LTFTDRLARFNRRLPNRAIAKVAGRRLSPVALVVHQGRRSGRRYRTPVMPLPLRDGFLAGGGSLRRGGRCFQLADPRLLDAAGATPLLPAALRPALRAVPRIRFLRLSTVRPDQQGADHARG